MLLVLANSLVGKLPMTPKRLSNANVAVPDQNKVRSEDRAVHEWYRFVLSFPPHLVQTYLQRFGVGSFDTVLDPFCGTGTTLVECKKTGISSVGIESNPMARFASGVKIDWSISGDGLRQYTEAVGSTTRRALEEEPWRSRVLANGAASHSLRQMANRPSLSLSFPPISQSCC